MFKRTMTSYGARPVPETPFQRAGQIWDERIGSARVQARNWRLMAFGCLALASVASAALIWRSLQSTVTPYVVEVDKFGEVRAVGPAIEHYQPSDAQIAHELAGFIANLRGLSSDPIVVRQNWLHAYDYVTDRAAVTLNDAARQHDPFADIGKITRSIEVTSVIRSAPRTFMARWVEQSFEHGALAASARFSGAFTIVIDPPRDAQTLRKNPLGLYIEALSFTQDLVTDPKSGGTP